MQGKPILTQRGAGAADPAPADDAHDHAHDDAHDHAHDRGDNRGHDHAHDHGHVHGRAHGHGHAHGPAHGHAHAHRHALGHAHAPAGYDRAFALGIALNTAFVVVEAGFGWKADSLALLADAGHNLSDVAGLVLGWVGLLAGRVRPSARHTYGFKRASILAAFGNAVLLLVAMGSLGWEAVHRLRAPVPVEGVTVMAVAAIGIVVNGATALLFLRGGEHDLNLRGAYLHMAGDALVSAGVVVAGALALAFGWGWIDPLASLAIAVVIVGGSWGLLRRSLHLLFDGVPEGVDLHAVQALLESQPGVAQVHDLHVWAMGTSDNALTAQLVMPNGHPDDAFLQQATRQLHERFGFGHVTLQVVREPFTPACMPLPRREADGER